MAPPYARAMSFVTLEPQLRKALEAELNARIPAPDEEAFEGFVESLRLSHPDLHRELIRGLKVVPRMPLEEESLKALRRARLRGVLDRLFFVTRWPNERVLDKKRVAYAVLLGLMLLFPLSYLLGGGSRPGREIEGQRGLPRAPSGEDAVLRVQASSSEGPAALPDLSEPAAGAEHLPDLSVPEPPEPADSRLAPFPTDVPLPRAPTFPASAQPGKPVPAPLPPSLALSAAPSPPGELTVWRQAPPSPSDREGGAIGVAPLAALPEARSLTVFTQLPATAALTLEGREVPAGALTVGADLAAEALAGPSVYERGSAGDGAPSLTASSVAEAPGDAQPGEARAPELPDAAPVPAASGVGLRPGMRIPAALSVGITVAEGLAVPAVAEANGDWCGGGRCPEIVWIGTARLLENDRVEVAFAEAIIDGDSRTDPSLALGEDGLLGLPVTSQDAAAEAARILLQSAAGGVSDYVRALAQQKRLTFEDGAVIQEGQVPGIGHFLLGALAEALRAPTGPSEPLRLATLPAGTPLTVLYGVGD